MWIRQHANTKAKIAWLNKNYSVPSGVFPNGDVDLYGKGRL